MKTKFAGSNFWGAMLFAAALLGCSRNNSGDVAGGGFETSDLNALVVDTNGVPVLAARVWLLAESGDSSGAVALDSLSSDSAGMVRFSLRGTQSLGLEVWKGDSLGIVLSHVAPSNTSPIRLVLRPARALTLGCPAFGSHKLLVSGSHFVQVPPLVCIDSFTIIFPSGPQSLLILPPLGGPPEIIPIQADSLPFWGPRQMPPGQGGPPQGSFPPPSTGGP